MTAIEAVQQIVGILVAGIVDLGRGIGQGVSSFVTSLAYTTVGEGSSATTQLSPFIIWLAIFASIGLAVGLTRLVFGWLQSFGARN